MKTCFNTSGPYLKHTYHSGNKQCFEGISLCIRVIVWIPWNITKTEGGIMLCLTVFQDKNQIVCVSVDAYKALVLSPEQFVSAQFFLASAKNPHIRKKRGQNPMLSVTDQVTICPSLKTNPN